MTVIEYKKKIDMVDECIVLNKLVSLLYLPDVIGSGYLHDRKDYSTMSDNLKIVEEQNAVEDSFIDIQVSEKSAHPNFIGIQEIDSTIYEKYISLPVPASPTTLSLFFHKGPSAFKEVSKEEQGVFQNFYAQPP